MGYGKGITVITCTQRPYFLKRIIGNYIRQQWKPKEMIVVLNRDDMKLSHYRNILARYPDIRVIQVSERKNLGSCLNAGIAKAKYGLIAKLDDDDYYGPTYLGRTYGSLNQMKADIAGKKTFYMYLEQKRLLIKSNPGLSNRFTKHVAGATLFFRKRLAQLVPFSVKLKSGTDVDFIRRSLKKGYWVYSGDPYDFVAIRRKNPGSHTWRIKDSKILAGDVKIIARTDHYRKHVRPNPRQGG